MSNLQAAPYILYGSYASYYTAKTRAYLRKKGIPFEERLPADPQFRAQVRPETGTARIPQLYSVKDGVSVQDTVTILDFLEDRHPDLPAIPPTPRQRVFVHLMELYASEGLMPLAWMHRWLFKENLSFVTKDFGRGFKPQGSDDELLMYGKKIADQMSGMKAAKVGLPKATDKLLTSLDDQYKGLLALFEKHLIDMPYFLGGHPCAADYAIMGALHAHMGRDPAGLRLMQDHAPRVFRWVEHMLVPDIRSPEFYNFPVEFCDDDTVPQTALDILHYISELQTRNDFVLQGLAFNTAMDVLRPQPGTVLDAKTDQPFLRPVKLVRNDREHSVSPSVYAVWVAQRPQNYFQSLSGAEQDKVLQMLGHGSAVAQLLQIPVNAKLERVKLVEPAKAYRMAIARL